MRLLAYQSAFAGAIAIFLGVEDVRADHPVAAAGPGVATHADLSPWLVSATQTRRFGCLMEINVPSALGSFDTWGLAGSMAAQSVEVDVRACPAVAADLNQGLSSSQANHRPRPTRSAAARRRAHCSRRRCRQ